MKKIIFIFLMIINFSALLQAEEIHVVKDLKIDPHQVSSISTATKRLEEIAQYYMDNAHDIDSVPRIGVVDLAFPYSPEEYIQMNGNGILMVSIVVHDKEELPLKKVKIKTGSQMIQLKEIKSIFSAVPDDQSSIKKLFGKYRCDIYYLIPYPLAIKKGEILADFNKNKTNFTLYKLPLRNLLNFTNQKMLRDQTPLNQETLKSFLGREFDL